MSSNLLCGPCNRVCVVQLFLLPRPSLLFFLWQPLFVAAANGDLAAVEDLLAGNADPDHKNDKEGATALHAAVEDGNEAIIKALLTGKANPNVATTDDGTTPLRRAAECANASVIKTLLMANSASGSALVEVDVNKTNGEAEGNTTPLYVAAQYGYLDSVQALLDGGADPNLVCSDDGSTPLLMAADGGMDEDENEEGGDGGGGGDDAAIAAAIANAAFGIAVGDGASGVSGSVGDGAASDAATSNAAFGIMGEDAAGESGSTGGGGSVDEAAVDDRFTPKFAEVVNALLAKSADPNIATTDDGSTPLLLAAQAGNEDVAAALLDAGANPNLACTDDNQTALYVAAETGQHAIVVMLLGSGAKQVSRTDGEGPATPLLAALANGHDGCAAALRAAAGHLG